VGAWASQETAGVKRRNLAEMFPSFRPRRVGALVDLAEGAEEEARQLVARVAAENTIPR
jgi:hypothetical protein